AHPQTELTTTITVPCAPVTAASTSSGVRASLMPRRVRSSLIGLISNSGYGIVASPVVIRNFVERPGLPWLCAFGGAAGEAGDACGLRSCPEPCHRIL